jgi:ATP-dependent DNA helicase RecG
MGLHHPSPQSTLAALQDRSQPAWQRLKFEELLAQQLSQAQARRERAALLAPPLKGRATGLRQQLQQVLPFALTGAQQRVVQEITAELARSQPMHRLLQGDVGSGKTVVAALAAAVAIDSGWQCALMAPTEILAEQHFRKLIHWLEPLFQPLGIGIAWLSGSRKGKTRKQMLEQVASGQAALVVGTHAVIQADVHFARLGLAIIDEQHRFGVQQRLELRRKLVSSMDDGGGPLEPHLLMMTATPIPRTLAMSYLADLDVSLIDEMPPGRTPVVTKLVSTARRDEVLERLRGEVQQGRQAYWVCPLVEESDLIDSPVDLTAATKMYEDTRAQLPDLRWGLLHGQLPPAEKAAVMQLFARGDLDVLVATTVIEVGVDVPNATLMVIEHAQRFGLAQLHQLRGRVGRGAAQSYCVLLYDEPLSPTARERLKVIYETTDGFEVARRDLALRGPGEFLGARQSGVPLLRFASLDDDAALVEQAAQAAEVMLHEYPDAAVAHVKRWMGARAGMLDA